MENHKEHFDSDNPEYQTCMRCGKPMRPRLAENALSRALDVYVCPECGTDEALHAAMDFFIATPLLSHQPIYNTAHTYRQEMYCYN